MHLLRMDHLENKRKEAAGRQAAYDKLSPQQKLELLDARLGKDQGAAKQRAKLAYLIANPHKAKKEEPKVVEATAEEQDGEEIQQDKPRKKKKKNRGRKENYTR